MKILGLLKGKTPGQIETAGDNLFARGEYGSSRLEYEKALSKLEKRDSETAPDRARIKKKMDRSCNALASGHMRNAKELMISGYHEDAQSLLALALELATDGEIIASLQERLELLKNQSASVEREDAAPYMEYIEGQAPVSNEPTYEEPGDHHFGLLVSTLPEEDQSAYHGYGEEFKGGYVSLNQGDFETAATLLSKAFEETGSAETFIPLELGTALLNLGHNEQAVFLLEGFLRHHPETIRAYPILCEIYWQNKEFEKAHLLLQNCPEGLQDQAAIHVLEGETFFHDNKYQEAEAHYAGFVKFRGWDEAVARVHAKTFEALGKKEEAKKQYAQILDVCQGCGKQTDPLIKQQYADLSLETGDRSANLLELYLTLIQEIPENRSENFEKISRIYALNGNEAEAGRFKRFAEQAK